MGAWALGVRGTPRKGTEQVVLSSSTIQMKQKKNHSSLPAFALALAAGLLVAGSAAAIPMTLTFDDGEFVDISDSGHAGGWLESNGIRSMGFWATNVGTPTAAFSPENHTHIDPNYSGRADGRTERIHAYTNDLQGIYITLESGASFDLVSIDYSITSRDSLNSGLARLGWATDPDHIQLLVSTAFDPTASDLESQWTQFEIDDYGLPHDPWPYGIWFTRALTGITGVNGVFISATAGMLEIDTLVIDVHTTTPIPEPSTAFLFGLGLMGIAGRRRAAR